MSKEFFQFCYDRYQQEIKDAEAIYQRTGVMLIVLPLLGTVTIALGRLDVLKLCFIRVDVFLYYFFSVVAICSIIVSAVFVLFCTYPRDYQVLESMDLWKNWRNNYQEYLAGKNADNSIEKLDKEMFKNLCERLVEAESVNIKINKKRFKFFQKSVLMSGVTFISVILQALFFLILKIQGV